MTGANNREKIKTETSADAEIHAVSLASYKPSWNILPPTKKRSCHGPVTEQQEQMETMTGELIGLFPLVSRRPASLRTLLISTSSANHRGQLRLLPRPQDQHLGLTPGLTVHIGFTENTQFVESSLDLVWLFADESSDQER